MNDKSDSSTPRSGGDPQSLSATGSLRGWLRGLLRPRNGEHTMRDALNGLIDDHAETETALDEDQRALLANVLELRERDVSDAMVPRADIVAVDVTASREEVVASMTKAGHSRLPIYRDTLDHVIGMVHIKDIAAWSPTEPFSLSKVMRKVLFVSPSMQVLELLLEMRVTRCHMALVVDEYGGVDGLVTIEDLVEEIVGEIEDEHDRTSQPTLVRRPDGTIDADARAYLEDLERLIGPFASAEEREDTDTLGGLVFALAGRVPIRGELISHPSGLEFEVVDTDPRRIKRLRIRGLPVQPAGRG